MKTITNIDVEINLNLDILKQTNLSLKEYSKARREVKHLKVIRMYLEYSPSEDYLKSEVSRLQKFITITIDRNFDKLEKMSVKNKAKFNKDEGLTLARKQLKNIKFILS